MPKQAKLRAEAYFNAGYVCSQSILLTYADQFAIDRETAARLAAPFGGGFARRAETCGAVTGACMILGLKHGHTAAEDLDSKEKTYQAVQQFISQFQARHGSIKCSQLLEIDISDPDNLQFAREKQLFTLRCPSFVSSAAEILDLLIAEN
jgi:C_GCAxxG_C_C family probable redox protein